jgi:hypothetical protein
MRTSTRTKLSEDIVCTIAVRHQHNRQHSSPTMSIQYYDEPLMIKYAKGQLISNLNVNGKQFE